MKPPEAPQNEDHTRQALIGFIVTRLVRVPTENLMDIVQALEIAEEKNQTPGLRLLERDDDASA